MEGIRLALSHSPIYPKGDENMISIWQIAFRIVAIAGSVGITALLAVVGIRHWLARRTGSKKPSRS
jgi:hypothetical protein